MVIKIKPKAILHKSRFWLPWDSLLNLLHKCSQQYSCCIKSRVVSLEMVTNDNKFANESISSCMLLYQLKTKNILHPGNVVKVLGSLTEQLWSVIFSLWCYYQPVLVVYWLLIIQFLLLFSLYSSTLHKLFCCVNGPHCTPWANVS